MLTFTSWPTKHCLKVQSCLTNYLFKLFPKHICKNTFLQCPIIWPLAPPRGMYLGAKTHGIEADPLRYPCSNMNAFWWVVREICSIRETLTKNFEVNKNTFQQCPRFWPLAPPRGTNPGPKTHGMEADPLRNPMVQIWMLSDEWLERYTH